MSDARDAVLMIKGIISELPEPEQKKFKDCCDEIKAVAAKHGEMGQVALGMLGAEIAAEQGA